ncbi:MAG: hypothetical protein CFE44_14260 [Burkholderiales bacterium PBB4]|nr:MAG: hypothetical protein CFE44_14260 [Burkholderiales bacterium PBB4]
MKYDDLVVGDLIVAPGSSRWLGDAVAAAGSRDIDAALLDARQLVRLIERRRDVVRKTGSWAHFKSGLREFALRGYGNCLEPGGTASFRDIMDNLRNATAIGLFAYAYQLMVKHYLTVLPGWLLGVVLGTAFVVVLAMVVVAVFQGLWMCDSVAQKFFSDAGDAVGWGEWVLRFFGVLIFAPFVWTLVMGVVVGAASVALYK